MAHDSDTASPQDDKEPEPGSRPHAVPADEMDFLDDAIPIDELTEEVADPFGFDFRDSTPGEQPSPSSAPMAAAGQHPSAPTPPPLPRGTGASTESHVELVPHKPARGEPVYLRKPVATGAGAVRCKTFIAKLRPEALERLDEQINAWLDANPGFEVKFATSAIGDLIGKSREPAMFVTVFV